MKLILIFGLTLLSVLPVKTEEQVPITANITMKESDSGCECIDYDCGCCQYLKWNLTPINGSLCANASYLERDYGISVTVTYNDFAIINETVSARNPPPICFGEDIVDMLQAEICLRLYDIEIGMHKYHLCFALLGRIGKIKLATLPLGCFNNKIIRTMLDTIETQASKQFHKKKVETTDELPNVIMV